MNLVYRTLSDIRIPGIIHAIMPWLLSNQDLLEAEGNDILQAIRDWDSISICMPLMIMTNSNCDSIEIFCDTEHERFIAINRWNEIFRHNYSLNFTVSDIVIDSFRRMFLEKSTH